MIKIFIGIVLVIITTFLGYRYADKFKYRTFVFEKLNTFNMLAVSQIGVTNITVENSINQLKNVLSETLKNVDAFLSGETFICEDKKLSQEQRIVVSNYINTLGTSDAYNQKQLLINQGEILKNEALTAKTLSEKFSKLSVRLGFSLGLIITVIII